MDIVREGQNLLDHDLRHSHGQTRRARAWVGFTWRGFTSRFRRITSRPPERGTALGGEDPEACRSPADPGERIRRYALGSALAMCKARCPGRTPKQTSRNDAHITVRLASHKPSTRVGEGSLAEITRSDRNEVQIQEWIIQDPTRRCSDPGRWWRAGRAIVATAPILSQACLEPEVAGWFEIRHSDARAL